jgi:hypothetical protein
VSDINTALVDRLKALDPNRPIREANIGSNHYRARIVEETAHLHRQQTKNPGTLPWGLSSVRGENLRAQSLPLPAPAEQTQCAEALRQDARATLC